MPAVARTLLSLLVPAGLALATATAAHAQQAAPEARPAVYVQLSGAENSTRAVQAGITWAWSPNWRWNWGGTPIDGYWDLGVAQWRFDAPGGGRDNITVLSFIPTFRFHTGGPGSAWFIDAGLGGTWASEHYATTEKRFATKFNFASQVGIGLRFGEQRSHELALRIQHVSNGGYKKPNPGDNFVQLRYALRF